MKKVSVIAGILFFCGTAICLAGPFEAQDEEATRAAQLVRDMLGGDSYEQWIKEEYINSEIQWGGRSFPGGLGETTFLVYCEVKQPTKEPFYYYYELKISSISDSPELAEKYASLYINKKARS